MDERITDNIIYLRATVANGVHEVPFQNEVDWRYDVIEFLENLSHLKEGEEIFFVADIEDLALISDTHRITFWE